ncbi:hydantoinase/oxoprolinase family protein [Ancylobacter sp. MQZ15Z-1]|uniref:Hydantoinase/oxoprolinase family protein n=1 Tax=Ancylobacter mangrovi TaxID=2972472 RepID=A0A9X2T378_9HYPH|nr:hydantoinase/oxoprolinase family protein [Ancylobacter mangrovi]MCS0494676.1 hydantoinase/oxoprolinase family protein [Ancylobacter mangrovi]
MTTAIDIDIGGTFTDCYIARGEESVWCKARTTAYDLSVCTLQAIEEGAAKLDLSVEQLLAETGIVRYSSTIAMNKLIQRNGPKVALITTHGFEDTIFIGRCSQWADGLPFKTTRNIARMKRPEPLVDRVMVVGVAERVDSTGEVIYPLDEARFLEQLRGLVDRGARSFVVSLLWSFMNPVHEQRIKELILEEYGDAYLGSMPVFLSSEVSPRIFEYPRTMMTLLNGYLHQAMYHELMGIAEEFRERAYRKPLMMVHNTGGMASVLKTSAVNTFNGGPVAGVMGSYHLAPLYGYKNVISADMGGTSFDIGMVAEGSTRFYQFQPVIDTWTVDATILDVRSIGAGGGSIIQVNPLLGNQLTVGPESAGSNPGPACYDQGGDLPTVTDADLVLGYLNPSTFHGGRLTLDRDLARKAVAEKVAGPLGVPVEEAALLAKRVIDGTMGGEIYKETVLKGFDPRDFILFALGGAGPVHATGFAEAAQLETVVVFPYSSTFCAFGSSTMDIVHLYEKSLHLHLIDLNGRTFDDFATFNAVVDALIERGRQDFRGEGVDPDKAEWQLELDMKFGGQLNTSRTISPVLHLDGEGDVAALYKAFEADYAAAYSAMGLTPEAGVEIENFVIRATVRMPKPAARTLPLGDADPSAARTGTRPAYWRDIGWHETDIYDRERLTPGNSFEGPALIEASDTTIVVEPGWSFLLDEYGNGLIRRIGAGGRSPAQQG